jgi:hypothetical protein
MYINLYHWNEYCNEEWIKSFSVKFLCLVCVLFLNVGHVILGITLL